MFQIAAASRIQGITPSTIVRLLRFVKNENSAKLTENFVFEK
jgi:tRNA U34 5-carboxymethylaminomethyl modifying enzyme MnmG/GidA